MLFLQSVEPGRVILFGENLFIWLSEIKPRS